MTNQNYFRKKDGESFLNLFNDMTFKRIFRSEEDKGLLVAFLNTIFEGKRTIVNVTYRNVEVQHPFLDKGRGCVFDILCTDENNDIYLIEMQYVAQDFILKRMLYYMCCLYVNEVKRGDHSFEQVKEVIGICITHFLLDDEKFRTEYELIDNTNLVRKYEKFKLIFLQIPRISDTFEKCHTRTEQWLYVMKNIHSIPPDLAGLRKEYARILELSKASNLTPEQVDGYLAAENRLLAEIDAFETAINRGQKQGMELGLKQGMEQGLQQGIEQGVEQGLQQGIEQGLQQGMEQRLQQGIEQGEKEATLKIARSLKKLNTDLQTMIQVTGLSPEEINTL